MKNKNYVVCRDNVYVGELVLTNSIAKSDGKDIKNLGELYVLSWIKYRSMLFMPDEMGYASDLLYDSSKYPILNMANEDVFKLVGNQFVVKDAYCLSDLLKYHCYNKFLTIEDIIDIRNKFFNGKYVKNHLTEFGLKDIDSKQNREIEGIQTTLPKTCAHILNELGDKPITYYLFNSDEKVNSFKPEKSEGKVKRLIKM